MKSLDKVQKIKHHKTMTSAFERIPKLKLFLVLKHIPGFLLTNFVISFKRLEGRRTLLLLKNPNFTGPLAFFVFYPSFCVVSWINQDLDFDTIFLFPWHPTQKRWAHTKWLNSARCSWPGLVIFRHRLLPIAQWSSSGTPW